jgi:hypothetical protein
LRNVHHPYYMCPSIRRCGCCDAHIHPSLTAKLVVRRPLGEFQIPWKATSFELVKYRPTKYVLQTLEQDWLPVFWRLLVWYVYACVSLSRTRYVPLYVTACM